MTETLSECRKVDIDFFNEAPILIKSEVNLPCSAAALFRCFEDADAWAEWVSVIDKVEWTSPKPFNVGTTRTVYMPGGMVAHEEFIAWDEPRHIAFRFNQFNQKFLSAFAENYEVADLGNDRCRLVWTVGIEQKGMAGLLSPLLKPFIAWNLRKISKNLEKYIQRGN
jgi:hypothetical protein